MDATYVSVPICAHGTAFSAAFSIPGAAITTNATRASIRPIRTITACSKKLLQINPPSIGALHTSLDTLLVLLAPPLGNHAQYFLNKFVYVTIWYSASSNDIASKPFVELAFPTFVLNEVAFLEF